MLKLSNNGESERQYLSLAQELIEEGDPRIDRTGVGTLALHGRTMRFNLQDGIWPLLTTKRIPWKAVAGELIWFLNGETNIRSLLEKNITIWSEWPHQKYVQETGENVDIKVFEQRILKDAAFAKKWGDLGPVYGKQWRRWQGPDGREYDQISDLMQRIQNDPYSRRLLFHGWNVADLYQMALPPCHLLYQFFVSSKGQLSATLYQRSADMGLGVPFNIASCALLIHMMAQQLSLSPGDLFWVGHDVHLYQNHVEPMKVQIQRVPTPFPTIHIKRKPNSLFDYQIEDFEPIGYHPQKSIPMPIAV